MNIKNKIRMKRAAAVFAAFTAAVSSAAAPVPAYAASKPYVAVGADLNAEQKETVYKLLGVKESELSADRLVTVTNAEEHEYLDNYVSADLIGTHSISSCKVVEESQGHGITVETHNITYCTPAMFQNALATAGMKNASVTVAAPTPVSGTAALVGAMKAYSKIYGKPIDPKYLDGATNELVTTGKLAEDIGDPQKAAEIIAAVKRIVAEKGLNGDQNQNGSQNQNGGQSQNGSQNQNGGQSQNGGQNQNGGQSQGGDQNQNGDQYQGNEQNPGGDQNPDGGTSPGGDQNPDGGTNPGGSQNIGEIIDEVSEEVGVDLDESQKEEIIDLMGKIDDLDLNEADLTEQAKDIYDKLRGEGVDLSNYGISEDTVEGLWPVIVKLFKAILENIRALVGLDEEYAVQ